MNRILLKTVLILFYILCSPVKAKNNDKALLYKEELKLYTQKMMHDPKTYISKFNKLREKSIKSHVWDVAADCLFYKACCFYYVNKSDSSIINSQKAIEEAEENHLDYIKAKGMGVLALEYSRKGFTNRAFETLEDALALIKPNDHLNKSLLYGMGFQISLYADDKKNMHKYSILNLNEAKLSGEKNRLRIAHIAKGEIELDLLNFSQAEIDFKEALRLSDPKDNYQNAHINLIFGELYYQQKKYDTATSFQLNALKSAMAIGEKHLLIQIYDDLKKTYKAENNIKDYQIADENSKELNDTLQTLNLKQQEVVLNSLEKRAKDAQQKKTKNYIVILIIASVLLSVALFFLAKYYKRFRKLSFTTKEKEDIINEKQQEINQLQEENQRESLEELLRSAVENDPPFLRKYQEAYSVFFEKLTALSPSLTTDDLKCCAMMHLNFSAKEIAGYTHSSIRTIENRKYRIRKKLNLDSSIDLNTFLRDF
ncbi:hypothetical protein EG344_18535 [Chryseobacterium sp. G0162]|uniref:hypothetical protein n=1 Tax=Chryseobacterium sp. G0162 TaxID=2487063 RepID=UPI000F4F0590|nr:hypothetical protein [Chryseobacterium sp. G0162]AZB10690.1 hypothetical protein EG344_18535 [Chryseobacterium sp. G0162]